MFSPDRTGFSTKNDDDFSLQISKHSSPIFEQHAFFLLFSMEKTQSPTTSYTRLGAPRSVLRLVGGGSFAMPVCPTHVRVSALEVMDYGLVKA